MKIENRERNETGTGPRGEAGSKRLIAQRGKRRRESPERIPAREGKHRAWEGEGGKGLGGERKGGDKSEKNKGVETRGGI